MTEKTCEGCKAVIDEFENWHKCKKCGRVFCELCSTEGEQIYEDYDGSNICSVCLLKEQSNIAPK